MTAKLVAAALLGALVVDAQELPPSLQVPAVPFGALEHVNLQGKWSSEQEAFWFEALRCSRDPRDSVILEVTNAARAASSAPPMESLRWVNVGLQQVHLPVGERVTRDGSVAETTLRGELVLSWPRDKMPGLKARLTRLGYDVSSSKEEDELRFVGPSGNRFVVRAGTRLFGPVPDAGLDARDALPGGPSEGLGIQSVRFDVRTGTAPRICRFYREIFEANSTRVSGTRCTVDVGFFQSLEFVERPDVHEWQGDHIALYVVDGAAFRRSYLRARDRRLLFHSRRAPHLSYRTWDDVTRLDEFRFKTIVDLDTGEPLYELEHEIRSLNHHGFLLDHRLHSETHLDNSSSLQDHRLSSSPHQTSSAVAEDEEQQQQACNSSTPSHASPFVVVASTLIGETPHAGRGTQPKSAALLLRQAS